MPRRTFAQAREILDELTLAPKTRREYERLLDNRVKKEVALIGRAQSETRHRIDDEATQLKQQLGDVEDALYNLEKESRSRDMPAAEYRSRLDELMRQRERIIARAMSLDSQVERFAEIEEDPEGHLDDLFQRYPAICPEFPW